MKTKITLIIVKILKILSYADRTKVNILDCLNRIKKIADKKDIPESYKERIEDMIKDEEILEQLKSGNEHLDKITKQFLLTHIREPKIGIQNFEDIKYYFSFGLNEYRICEDTSNTDYSKWTIKKLLIHFTIDKETYNKFKDDVNDVLKSYTDDKLDIAVKRKILRKQILSFTGSYPEEDVAPQKKMWDKLSKDIEYDRNIYLDGVINAMKEAHLNQIVDNKYMIVSQLFDRYNDFLTHCHTYNFKDKKEYLKKISDRNKAISKLSKYLIEIHKQEPADFDTIKWFIFYLIYNKDKFDIYMIHSMLGIKYKGAVKLYQKLFCKDKSTGKDNKFILHTDIEGILKTHICDPIFLDEIIYEMLVNKQGFDLKKYQKDHKKN